MQRRYWPQLDGVRAVAIVLVVAYHLGYLHGGWVGVDVFFVLSGYLITSILLAGDGSGRALATFWGHRARRLLPAVLVLLIVLSVYAGLDGQGLVPAQLRDPALATLLYVANWQQIIAGHSYFAHYASVNPLQQTWSLAVEEQYYLCWPLLLAVAGALGKARPSRDTLARCTIGLALLSAVWMGIAAHLYGADRAYLGTDTRAWELLLGGAAAMRWPPEAAAANVTHQRRWSRLTVLGVLAVALGAALAGGPPHWVWYGGLVAIAVGAALMIIGTLRGPDAPLARALAAGPLRWLGTISYSLYLWHWPVIVLMTEASTGLSGVLLLFVRLGTMLVASCASFYLIERPLRRADWGALRRRLHVPALSVATASVVLSAAIILVGTIGPAQAGTAPVAAVPISEPTLGLDIPRAPPGHPYRVWILGDSVMDDSSLGIIAALQATGDVKVVINDAFPGWGLSTFPTWRSEVRQVVAQYHPQIVIGTWSWDDQEATSEPAAYRAELEAFVGAILAPGDGVELVSLLQFPQIGPDDNIANLSSRQTDWKEKSDAQNAWNTLAQQAVAAYQGRAVYLTTQQLFAPDNHYLTWMRTPAGDWVRARKLDNTHMCPYGAAQFGALVTEELTPILDLPPLRPGWEYGAWTHDPRYNNPPGACPDDQPPPGYQGIPVP